MIWPSSNASKDYGFMYQHGFEDLDGHLWALVHMVPSGECEE
ncbi:hypothetical protein [Noviherbaspirillum cavernae]